MTENIQSSLDPLKDRSDLPSRLLDSLTAKVAALDANGTITYVNDAWKRFAAANGGSPQATGVGVNYFDVCRRAYGDEAALASQACRGIQQVLRRKREVFKLEYPCHSPTEQRWFLLYVSRLKGERTGAVATHLGITERKLTEERLVVAERLAAIGQAMQGLSHEGRNALQRSQAALDLLKLHVAGDDEATTLLERVERAQDELLGRYEEVRCYAGPISLRREPCCLDDMVEEVWTALAPSSRGVTFSHTRHSGNLSCKVDESRIRDVLRIVLENALATAGDPIEIGVTYVDEVLDGFPAITIVVSDNGPGVPVEDRERVFEPFYTTKQKGTGLGLAMAKRIVAAHGGQIRLEGSAGVGAAVHITLPVNRRQQDNHAG